MTPIWVSSISVFGQGLPGWSISKDVLCDFSKYNPEHSFTVQSRFLTPNNKRRTTAHMQIAILAADHALLGASLDETEVELIFASSEADIDIAHDNLQALVHKEKELSPQKFQNVILNAGAGHLGIFMKNRSGSTSVSGTENCFSVGLLQAYTSLLLDKKNALLVVYDAPSQMPYGYKDRPPFGVGMVLSKDKPKNFMAGLMLKMDEHECKTKIDHEALETIRKTTPAATCLPLLVALAKKECGPVELYYSKESVLTVTLCF